MSRSQHLVMPEAQSMLAMFASAMDGGGVAEMRAGMAAMMAAMPPPSDEGVTVSDRTIKGLNGAPDVPVRIYVPSGAKAPWPVHLDIHGGGYIAGDLETDRLICRDIVRGAGCAVVSVDYRLAPETRWQGSSDDNYAALLWIASEGPALGFDVSRLTIGGESAGGGHAAALAIRARDEGGPKIRLQLLGQPMLDDRTCAAEPHPFTGEYVWTHALNRLGWGSLLGVEPGSDSVPAGAVPSRCADLAGLPPAFIIVGSLDLFVEEDIEYARRLMRAGVPTELHVLPGMFHGAASVVPDAALSKAYFDMQFAALRRAVA
jgi:triacylglycerol lipase